MAPKNKKTLFNCCAKYTPGLWTSGEAVVYGGNGILSKGEGKNVTSVGEVEEIRFFVFEVRGSVIGL